MTTLRQYIDVARAELDKSLLEAAGIPSFIADENSLSIGYGSILGGVRLQVQDADADRARRVLQEHEGATPLPDDFIPPEVPPPEEPVETVEARGMGLVPSAVVTFAVLFVMIAAFRSWTTSHGAIFYYNRGIAKQVKGNLDGAIADYDRAIELNPRYAHAYTNRGRAKRVKGNLDGALADYDRAIELDPDDVRAYCNRGFAKWTMGHLDDALADYDRAIELDPNDARVYNLRGFTKRTMGDLDGALADYNRAIKTDPKFAIAYAGRGFVKRMKGNLDGATADYDRALELDPKDVDAYYGRGVARYDKRDWSNALLEFRKASTLKPTVSKLETLQDYSHIRIWMARAKLGERVAATNELKQYLLTRTIGKPGDWLSTIIRLLTGDLSENDFLKAAGIGDEKQARNQKCEAYFYAGTILTLISFILVAACILRTRIFLYFLVPIFVARTFRLNV